MAKPEDPMCMSSMCENIYGDVRAVMEVVMADKEKDRDPQKSFDAQSTLHEADVTVAEVNVIQVSERDFARIVDLLDNPPDPNAKLLAAAAALPKAV
jgi:uncharacterized protein (DUF1778 family)